MATLVFKINAKNPDTGVIKIAAEALREGKLVVFPTETVYGIAADRDNPEAIKKLREVKNRPEGKPFTVHIHSIKQLEKFGCEPAGKIKAFLKKSWPGPLTAVLKTKNGERIGFRIPDNKIALKLLKYAEVSVVAPSANISGEKAPISIEEIPKGIKDKAAFILDGGKTKLKVSSTVIDFTEAKPRVLRK